MADDDNKRRAFEEARHDSKSGASSSGAALASLRSPKPVIEPWDDPHWPATGELVLAIFLERWGKDFSRIEAEGWWLHWTGQVWEHDQCALVERQAAALCRMIGPSRPISAKKGKGPTRTTVEGAPFIGGLVRRLKAELAVAFERFDCADVLNCPDGTISLAVNGHAAWTLQPHRREDLCTKMTLVTPLRGPCPQFLAFLRRIMADDNDMVDYLQRWAGYNITRSIAEQVFFIHYGSGQNGKGTLLHIIQRLLGGYAMAASLDLFLETRFEAHPEELAALPGKRFVVASEANEGRSWNEAKIKSITGGDTIRARHMRQDSFEFQPCCKVNVSTNHPPAIKNVDVAMRRRIQMIPYLVKIPDSERDNNLEDRLIREEGPQILAWALDGLDEYRKHGLAPPDKVLIASSEYVDEQDIRAQWLGTCCNDRRNDNPSVFTFTMTLHQSWSKFAKNADEKPGSIKSLATYLKNQGFQHNHQNNGNGFYGIELKGDPRDNE